MQNNLNWFEFKIAVDNYLQEHGKRMQTELFDFLRIRSVSAYPDCKDVMQEAASFVKEQLVNAGAELVEICPTKGHPVVFGQKFVNASLPTVLVYGHYDVQPPEPLDLWETPPFQPTVRYTPEHPELTDDSSRTAFKHKGGAIYARGASDDKGQVFMHIKALELMLKTENLACNVQFIIEGEEEIGSPNLPEFINKVYKNHLHQADMVLISDTSMISNDTPSIECGLRGICCVEVALSKAEGKSCALPLNGYLKVTVSGPNRDLHSGIYGGAVANPLNGLCALLVCLKDLTVANDAAVLPHFAVLAVWGGYTGQGSKTVLPAEAFAQLGFRQPAGQSPENIAEKLQKDLKEKVAVKGLKVAVIVQEAAISEADAAIEPEGQTDLAANNPIVALADMIAALHDENHQVAIPGFYEQVLELSPQALELLNTRSFKPFNLDDYQADLGIDTVHGEAGYTTIERIGIRPTLDLNGLWGGQKGVGKEAVFPDKASAKISMRLVPNQDTTQIAMLFKTYFDSLVPKGMKLQVTVQQGANPIVLAQDSIAYRAASDAIKQTFGQEPISNRGGGSIPIVALFKQELGLDSLLMGFGLDSDALHAPNEKFGLDNYYKGIETIPYFFRCYAQLFKAAKESKS